jgi:hypothetical protein
VIEQMGQNEFGGFDDESSFWFCFAGDECFSRLSLSRLSKIAVMVKSLVSYSGV